MVNMPPSAFLLMALEAARQVHTPSEEPASMCLADIQFKEVSRIWELLLLLRLP